VAPNPAGGDRPPVHEEDLWSDDGGGVDEEEGDAINKRPIFDSTHTHTHTYIIILWR